ncbi:UDP-glucose/GDP-mannose dehydrogenase family protein [soil metagenome]
MAQISIIGSGYVGLVYGVAFADLGNDVIGVDIDAEKVKMLQSGICPIYEPRLPELLASNLRSGRIRFTTDYAEAIPQSDFVFICVDTPSTATGEADMRAVRSAATMLAEHLKEGAIVVNKSTMPIGSGDFVSSVVSEHMTHGRSFSVISNPEFLREGSAVSDVFHPDRIVLGTDNDHAAIKDLTELYRALDAPILVTDRRSAEMVKYASNSFLATKISFINEMAQICERVGADVSVVAEGMGYDERIGPLFLQAGVGYGGSCFPKDVKALAYMAHEADCHPQLLHAVMEINHDQRRRYVKRLQDETGDLFSKDIAVWGLSFKENTDDIRESPSIDIINMMLARGARVRAYDPAAMDRAREELPKVELFGNPYDAVEGADALCVITPWNEFKQANMSRVVEVMRNPVLLDGRNLYSPDAMEELGFTYVGVGR